MPARWEVGGEKESAIAQLSVLGLSQTERVVDTDNVFVFERHSPYCVSTQCGQGMRGILASVLRQVCAFSMFAFTAPSAVSGLEEAIVSQ